MSQNGAQFWAQIFVAAEMLYYVAGEITDENDDSKTEYSNAVIMSQSCMDCQEFDRAVFFLSSVKNQNHLTVFLLYYSRFLVSEKKRLDNLADVTEKRSYFGIESFSELRKDLEIVAERGQMDGFLHYLHGLVLLALKLRPEARVEFEKSINAIPAFWPAWSEMAKLVDSRYELRGMHLPDHWLRTFFLADVHHRLQKLTLALDFYKELVESGFGPSPYIVGKMAAVKHQLQDHDSALDGFRSLHEMDPCRVEQMDLYSDSLYVRAMRVELATLSHHFYDINKFCPETCCIVGNYYSLCEEHERAALYFQRALKLDPRNSGVWTLVGHEFMEMKNTSVACLAYHRALEIDKRDYRGWYGLGQMYDILKMPAYALYYYKQAHKCRPDDSRMIVALGEMYAKQGRFLDAQKCFWKAHTVGDIEGTALVRLGKLFEKEGDHEQAALCYVKYLKQMERQSVRDDENQSSCYRFLAKYCLDTEKYDEAHHFAQLCLDYDVTKEDGRSYLKKITQNRNKTPEADIQMDT